MQYEIFNQATGNLVDVFATEREALEMVREVLNDGGWETVKFWCLGAIDESGEVLQGMELIAKAEQLPANGTVAGD